MSRESRRPAAGFTLAELVVAVSLFGIVSSAAFSFMLSQARFYDAGGRAQTAQQEARGAMRIVVAEVRRAGAGINILTVSDPDIFLPNDGTGSRDAFDPHAVNLVSVNASVPRIPLTRGANNGRRNRTYVTVPDSSNLGGLRVGDRLYIENSNSANTQLLKVTRISAVGGGKTRIDHVNEPLEVDYPPSSSALWSIREMKFRGRLVSGDYRIERKLPGATGWEVLSENATGVTFRYFDGAGNLVTPTSRALRTSVRRIEVEVTITVPGPTGRPSDRMVFTYKSSISPRNQSLDAY